VVLIIEPMIPLPQNADEAAASSAMKAPTMPTIILPIRFKTYAAYNQAGEPAGDRACNQDDDDCFDSHGVSSRRGEAMTARSPPA
jgi:hypothetical protein